MWSFNIVATWLISLGKIRHCERILRVLGSPLWFSQSLKHLKLSFYSGLLMIGGAKMCPLKVISIYIVLFFYLWCDAIFLKKFLLYSIKVLGSLWSMARLFWIFHSLAFCEWRHTQFGDHIYLVGVFSYRSPKTRGRTSFQKNKLIQDI